MDACAQLATVNRTSRIFEVFTYAEPVRGVSELARKVGMGKSIVHRALVILTEAGYLAKTPDSRYRLGWKLHELGRLVVSGLRLHAVAHEPLERLRRECDLAINLVVLDGRDAVYIEQFESAGLAKNSRRAVPRAVGDARVPRCSDHDDRACDLDFDLAATSNRVGRETGG